MQFLKVFRKREHTGNSEQERLALYRSTGDIALLGTLYEPYMEMVFSVCFKYLKDENECKDAVMQIFEKLITDLRRHEVENLRSWLHTVTRNHCLMQLRVATLLVRTVENAGTERNYADESEPTYRELFEKDQMESLHKCLDGLAKEQAVSVRLFYMEEKCYREIGEITGYDSGKVKSYIQNGKRNLKICLEKNGSR